MLCYRKLSIWITEAITARLHTTPSTPHPSRVSYNTHTQGRFTTPTGFVPSEYFHRSSLRPATPCRACCCSCHYTPSDFWPGSRRLAGLVRSGCRWHRLRRRRAWCHTRGLCRQGRRRTRGDLLRGFVRDRDKREVAQGKLTFLVRGCHVCLEGSVCGTDFCVSVLRGCEYYESVLLSLVEVIGNAFRIGSSRSEEAR